MNDVSRWQTVPLLQLGDWYGGGTPDKSRTEFWAGGTIPWLSPKDMRTEVIIETRDHITPAAVAGSSVRLVPPGSVAIVVRSGILERTLPIAVVPASTTLNQDMKALAPRPGVDPRWVAWGLRAKERELLERCRKDGTTVSSLDTKRLMDEAISVPALTEQRRIVDVLEDHLSRLGATARSLGAAARRAQTLSAATASSLMHLGAAGLRTHDVAFGAAVAAVPEHWRISTVGAEAELVEYGSGAKAGAQLSPRDVPVLRMGNVKLGRIDSRDLKYLPLDHPDTRKLTLQPGDLLFNRTNSAEHVGKAAVYAGDPVRACFASYLIRVRFKNGVDPCWAALVINSPLGRSFVASVVSQQVGQANVNGTKLRAFPLPLPPLEEQQALVERHMSAVDAGTRLSSHLASSRRRQEALRRSLLDAAFSGRL